MVKVFLQKNWGHLVKPFLALFTDKETEAQREVTHLCSHHCQKERLSGPQSRAEIQKDVRAQSNAQWVITSRCGECMLDA